MISRVGLLLLAMTGGGAAMAQPTSVDIDLRRNATGDSLLLYVRPNGQGFSQVVSGLTFTIRWEAASNATLVSRTQFCPEAFSISASGDGEIDNGAYTYRTYNAFGAALIQNECPDRAWVQNAWNLIMRIKVDNVNQCTNFNVVNDAYTAANNKNFYVSLGGDPKTGVIEPTVAQLGACTTDCLGVIGGSALPGTACNDNNACTTNDTWNVSCQCVGTAIAGPSITSSGSNSPICAGSTLSLNAVATGSGTITYSWSGPGFTSGIQNPTIANATTAATGVYTVTASNGCGTNATANVSVTVTAAPTAGSLSGGQNICVGGSTTFSSTVSGGTWSSSNTGVATINSSTGAITGMGAGTATMTYTVAGTGGCSNATATRTVTVTAAPTAGSLSGGQSICVGGSTTFSSTVGGGTWNSSNTGVATINSSTGVITGMGAGTATMTYTVAGTGGCSNATATRTVTVTAAPTAGSLSGGQSICVGGSTTFSSTVGGGTWNSSNTGVATINSSTGAITGMGAGTATMT
ncbi:MAG: hypothetical protein E6Q44_07040, partial [Flavobacteriales bacterium]